MNRGFFDLDWYGYFDLPTFTTTHRRLYDSDKYELKLREEYVQKEIDSLKTNKKRYKQAITDIDKQIEELSKRIE